MNLNMIQEIVQQDRELAILIGKIAFCVFLLLVAYLVLISREQNRRK